MSKVSQAWRLLNCCGHLGPTAVPLACGHLPEPRPPPPPPSLPHSCGLGVRPALLSTAQARCAGHNVAGMATKQQAPNHKHLVCRQSLLCARFVDQRIMQQGLVTEKPHTRDCNRRHRSLMINTCWQSCRMLNQKVRCFAVGCSTTI